MVTYGGYDYGIYLCDEIDSDLPAGNIFRLMVKNISLNGQFYPDINSFLDGLSYDVNMGEREVFLDLIDGIFYAYGGNTKTDMYNILTDFIFSHSQKGCNYIYCFIRNLNDDQYMRVGYLNVSNTNINYIIGRFVSYKPSFSKGNIMVKRIGMVTVHSV